MSGRNARASSTAFLLTGVVSWQVDFPLKTVLRQRPKEPSHDALTLQQCLEEVAQFGPDYLLIEQDTLWTAPTLLAFLALTAPERLNELMYLRLPDSSQDGAICQLTRSGGFLRRYRIVQLTPP